MFRRDNGRCEQEMNFQHLGGRPECDEGPRQFLPVVRRALEGPVSLSVSNRMKRRLCVCKVVIFPLIAPFDVLCGRVRAYRRDAGCGGGEIGACIGPIP